MSLELDKRIKALTDIQSVTNACHDLELMNKKGYFADRVFDFKDLKRTCVYGEYVEYREHDKCFLCEIDHYDGTFDHTYYRYFIPEDVLSPEEPKKKYRPFSLEEFLKIFDIGDQIDFKGKGYCDEVKVAMFTGYITDVDRSNDEEPGAVELMLGCFHYSLLDLFKDYELFLDDEWQPFGVVDE